MNTLHALKELQKEMAAVHARLDALEGKFDEGVIDETPAPAPAKKARKAKS